MSAINLRNVKRDFSQLNYRPDVCHPDLIDGIENVLEATGLRDERVTVVDGLNARSLVGIVQRVCSVCYANGCDEKTAVVVFAFLAKMYTEHCVDDTVKRTLTKCLKSCPERWQSQLSAAVLRQFISVMENERNQCETEYFLKTLNECCEKFPNFISNCVGKVVRFFELNLRKSYSILIHESSPTQKISAIRCIHESFRFFLAAYRKDLFPKTLHFSDELNACFMELIDSDQLPMETLFNCCLSIVYTNKDNVSALECWKICLSEQTTRSDLIKLGFCVAALNTFTSDELMLIEPDSGKSICANIFDIIMEASCRNLNDSSILISSSRVLFVLSKRLCASSDISLEKHQFDSLITFLWLRMDHFLDGVRHLARDTMMNIIKIKDKHILNEILERLSTCDTNSKAFATILTILSDKVDSELIIKYLPRIAEDLIHLMNSNNSAVTIFMNLMLNHYSITESKLWFDYWLCLLFRNADLLDVKHFEQIITKAVQLMPDILIHIHNLSSKNELSLKIYLICFNVEKKLYMTDNSNTIESWINQTKFETLKKALHSNDANIRFIAINLILDCQKKTQIFTDKELELIKYFITYNNKNEKASIKQIHLSFLKKMLLRMKESQFSVAVRNDETLNLTVTKYYTEFQCWFSKFCFHNIFSDATFSRRNFSLESLRLIQTCLSPLGVVGLDKYENVSVLFNCLWDTYEQNKILAKDILTYENQDSIKLGKEELEILLEMSRKLASSTSPPDSITAGYLFEVIIFFHKNIDHEDYMFAVITDLVNDLEKEIDLAKDSLTLASAKGPMYGLIHCVRHLLNTCNWQTPSLRANWTNFIKNISTICLKCIELVSVVVNDSSPEGIVPMDDLCQNEYQVTSQMVLLCSWRSTKESSLLLSDIVSVIAAQESDFSNALVTQICSCLTLLLSETKHRGAFEQIFVAYLKVCSIMWKSPTLHEIPLKYLEDVLTEIKTGLGKTFCVTRRSAGMPFIIQALICTNHDKRKTVDYTMETLLSICENKNITENLEIGVVHAQNVLRALFRCSQLGDLVGPFVSRGIDVSIVLFNSSSWPIRNSSTLLLSALVNRVFGVSRSSTELSWKNRMTGREFFQRYPELYDTFLNEFQKFSPLDMRPSLYPTLLILARLFPSANEATDCVFQLAVYIPYIFKCAQSPVMKTRMLAATSLAPQVTQNKLVEHLYITYNELISKRLKENTIHGLLLQVFSLVENLPKLEVEDLHKLVTLTEDILTNYDRFTNCSLVVQEVFLRCITCLWLQLDDLKYDSIKHVYTSTLESITKLDQCNNVGRSKYLESAVLFLFSISLKVQIDFSKISHNIIESKIHCRTVFEVLSIILSEKSIEFCDHLEKFKHFKYWNRQVLMDQLTTNSGLIELICQQCSISDSLIDVKYLVLSSFTPALMMFFEKYVSIDDYISKLCNLRKDSEIAHSLFCINGYMCKLKSSKSSTMIIKLMQVFENIYYAQRSDSCKSACVDIIVDNYNLIIDNKLDVKIFLRLWTLMIHYAEDDSEDVRNHVWRLINKDTNCSKSFELLFDRFGEHFNVFPSAVLAALICWSYLDVELPQDRLEGQVFDGEDTSQFKEHTVRQTLALDTIVRLTNSHPESMNLELNKRVQEWITEEWTCNSDVKPTTQNLSTIGNLMAYSKEFYTKTMVSLKIPHSANTYLCLRFQ